MSHDPSGGPYVPDGYGPLDKFYEGEILETVLSPFMDSMGPLFPMLMMGGIMTMLWVYSDDVKTPTVVGIIMSAVSLVYLPASMLNIIGGMFVFLIAVALFSVWSGRDVGDGSRT